MDSSKRRYKCAQKFSDILPNNNIKTPKIIKKDLNNNILALEDFEDQSDSKRSSTKNF